MEKGHVAHFFDILQIGFPRISRYIAPMANTEETRILHKDESMSMGLYGSAALVVQKSEPDGDAIKRTLGELNASVEKGETTSLLVLTTESAGAPVGEARSAIGDFFRNVPGMVRVDIIVPGKDLRATTMRLFGSTIALASGLLGAKVVVHHSLQEAVQVHAAVMTPATSAEELAKAISALR